ncbi:RNA polymerase III transcription factor subunit [Penicillium pulvis]|uniref:RNA polymerase III transcription factor subunit n=1 Tax=Penicillium pulvis TaxID=1562058 RepID=UPI002548CE78|nr:RNA polymerase III transcription factor subunit [Penicillium pulvis]KAJ5786456.1 RNA polymerase III transcription factor subunit [Penicillium pulvis]
MDTLREARTAPSYNIPSRQLISVEHPAVIRNIDKAIDTLQGNTGVNKIMNPARADAPAHLLLRPEDAMARPLVSTVGQTNNILLKVTVPKRTGRKRKRGSDEPFTEVPEEAQGPQRHTAKDLMRSLHDNPSQYKIQPVGKVERTHVFRGMPDFVYSTTNSVFTKKFRDYIVPYDLEKMKRFDIDLAKGTIKDADIIPPPALSSEQVPFLYMYRQNPGVKQTLDASGRIITENVQQATKIRTHLVGHDVPEVPSKPQESLPPIETLDITLRRVIEFVTELFEKRPIWTRRAIRNFLHSDEQRYLLRLAIPYVGYIFRAGPWRDGIIKLGVDPRTSPEFRHYQTFMFRLMPGESDLGRDGSRRDKYARLDPETRIDIPDSRDSYIFTGKLPLHQDGRIWMVCDIKDPLLKNLLYPPEESLTEPHLRETCEIVSDGWYGSGTLAKVKIIMRAKIASLLEGVEPDDAEYMKVSQFPNFASSEAEVSANFQVDPRTSTPKEISLATEIRAAIKSAPQWRRINAKDKEGEERKGKGKGVSSTPSTQRREMNMDEYEDGDLKGVESEGEEEEMERVEILEEQVAAALAAREAAEEEEEDNDMQEDDDDEEGEEEEY